MSETIPSANKLMASWAPSIHGYGHLQRRVCIGHNAIKKGKEEKKKKKKMSSKFKAIIPMVVKNVENYNSLYFILFFEVLNAFEFNMT